MPIMLDDPAVMTPSQRRREIAAILARGVLRLRQCRTNPPSSALSDTVKKAFESPRNCLAAGPKTSPHGVVG